MVAVSDSDDDPPDEQPDIGDEDAPGNAVPNRDGTPTVSCSRCSSDWDLTYELDGLQVGNRAIERFALDHYRHTGHYPDDVTPWIAACRQCPDEERFLSEQPARRFAETHARHTSHTVELTPPDTEDTELVGPEETV